MSSLGTEERFPNDWAGLHNTLHTMSAHNMELPEGFTAQLIEDIAEHSGWESAALYKNNELIRLGIGRFIKDILDKFDERCFVDVTICCLDFSQIELTQQTKCTKICVVQWTW